MHQSATNCQKVNEQMVLAHPTRKEYCTRQGGRWKLYFFLWVPCGTTGSIVFHCFSLRKFTRKGESPVVEIFCYVLLCDSCLKPAKATILRTFSVHGGRREWLFLNTECGRSVTVRFKSCCHFPYCNEDICSQDYPEIVCSLGFIFWSVKNEFEFVSPLYHVPPIQPM